MHKSRDEIAKSFELPEAIWRAEDWADMHVYHRNADNIVSTGRLLNCPEGHIEEAPYGGQSLHDGSGTLPRYGFGPDKCGPPPQFTVT